MSAARLAAWLLLALAGLYALLCMLLYAGQRSLLYAPQAGIAPGIPARVLDRQGVAVRVLARERPGTRAVLYFGGNAEDVSRSLDDLSAAFPDHTLLLMNYRGYNGSGGAPTESALQGDALALYDEVRPRHSDITVIGRSLGSGIAIRVAAERNVERLVLVTPYDSIAELAQRLYPWMPVRRLLKDRYESLQAAPKVTAPTVIVVGTRDTIIPRERSDALYRRFRLGVACIVELEGVGHNDLGGSADYRAALAGP